MLIGQRTRWIDKGKSTAMMQLHQERRIEKLGVVSFDTSLKGHMFCLRFGLARSVENCTGSDNMASVKNAVPVMLPVQPMSDSRSNTDNWRPASTEQAGMRDPCR
eukprot:10294583-Prorocentrum_lima.AAC.1